VSLLLDLGVPPHIVRDIVGHSDIEVTMTIYAHAALDEKGRNSGRWGMPSAEDVAVKRPQANSLRGLLAAHMRWAGAGSNRRPSAFQE
jgi:hypothetical protein